MLILQVFFTIIAWLRGWKWYALIPLTVGVISSILFKYIIINLTDPLTLKLIASIVGVAINIVLLIMSISAPKKEELSNEEELHDNSTEIDNDSENKIINTDSNEEIEKEESIVLEVIEEVQHDNEEKSIGCELTNEVANTNKYYYAIGRKKKGPITEDELVKLNLKPETLIWTDGLDKWQPLSDFGIIKTPPPLPKGLFSAGNKRVKKTIFFIVLLIVMLSTSFIASYYIMESQKDKYLKEFKDEIDKLFSGEFAICGGEKYRTQGDIMETTDESQYYDKSLNPDYKFLPQKRFYSKGIIFKYGKLMKHGSEYWFESYSSTDLEYFANYVINGEEKLLVTPEEAYNSCYFYIRDENAECYKEDFYERFNSFKVLNNKYYHIYERKGGSFGRKFGNIDYYVYYNEDLAYYHIRTNDSTINQDFRRILFISGGISILFVVLLYTINPFKW